MNFTNYLSLVNSQIYHQRIKLELLRQSDESIYDVIDTYLENTSSSTLNIQWVNGMRKACSITLINLPNSPYYIDPDSIYVNTRFKLWLGLEDETGNVEWSSQGIYLMADPSVTSNFSQSELTLNLVDKFGMFSTVRGELEASYQIPVGTDISSAIQSILTLMNDPKPPIIHSSLVGKTLPYTIIKDIGAKLGDLLLEIASINSNNIYYNNDGYLVVEPDFDFNTLFSQWDYTTEQFQYLGNTRLTYKFSELYNAVLVTSTLSSGLSYSAKVQNNNLLSPVSIPNIGYERIFPYKSEVLSSNQMCEDLANYILTRKTTIQSEVSFYSIPMYHYDVSQVITLTDNNLKLNKDRYIVNSISLPLNTGAQMTVNCVKIKELDTSTL